MINLPISGSKYNWILRYKLYHLPFWALYHFIWWTLGIGSAWQAAHLIFFSHSAIKFLFYVVFQALGVYFNLYFLIPRFLEKGRYVPYIFLLALCIVCTACFIVAGYYASALWSDQTFKELWGVEPTDFFHFFKNGSLPSTVGSMTLAMSIKLTKNWIQAQRREELLEKEKLETELKFLRAQFNPHFLFNTINSIFVLINKNSKMASEALAKFSDLLRYQLYECNEPQISLDREVMYLNNFIELQKLRLDGNVKLTFSIAQPLNNHLTVAPFIIMPFIENAFKHVSQYKEGKNWIEMDLHFDHNQLTLTISNSVSRHNVSSNELVHYNGIGLKNVQRRLDLLYPSKHNLIIKKDNGKFEVILDLYLAEQEATALEKIEIA